MATSLRSELLRKRIARFRAGWIFPSWLGSLLVHSLIVLGIAAWFRGVPAPGYGIRGGTVGVVGIIGGPGSGLESNELPGAPEGNSIEITPATGIGAEVAETQQSELPPEVATATTAAPTSTGLSLPTMDDSPSVPAARASLTAGTPGDQRDAAFGVPDGAGNSRDLVQGGAGGSGRGGNGLAGAGSIDGVPGATFLGASDRGTRVAFVIDSSSSMENHHAMRSAKAALVASLQSLTDTQQFQIVFYNNTPTPMQLRGRPPNELLFATEINKTLARQYIASVVPDLGTDHLPALKLALKTGAEVIFFLTDADEPELSAGELNDLRQLNKGRARIHTIEFGVGPEVDVENFLKKLARQNGGTYRYMDVKKLTP